MRNLCSFLKKVYQTGCERKKLLDLKPSCVGMFFGWFWAALVVSPLRTPTPMYTNFQDIFLTKLFQSRKVWIGGPRIRTVKSADCFGHGPCSVVVLMLNMCESPLIVDLQCRIIKHDKTWECLTWPALKSSNYHIDIVSSQLYVCHILVSKKCQLQAGTIHPRPLA